MHCTYKEYNEFNPVEFKKVDIANVRISLRKQVDEGYVTYVIAYNPEDNPKLANAIGASGAISYGEKVIGEIESAFYRKLEATEINPPDEFLITPSVGPQKAHQVKVLKTSRHGKDGVKPAASYMRILTNLPTQACEATLDEALSQVERGFLAYEAKVSSKSLRKAIDELAENNVEGNGILVEHLFDALEKKKRLSGSSYNPSF